MACRRFFVPSKRKKRLIHSLLHCFTVLLLGVPCSRLLAADVFEYGGFRLRLYTEADGLISAETNGVYKDAYGFLWVSTFNGLSRFDGRSFQNFGRESGLTESNVDLIGNDAAGHLFIKSISAVYQYTGNGPVPFLHYPSKGGFIAAACPTDTARVWVAYEGEKGLHLLSAKGEAGRLPTEAEVRQLVQGKEGMIYVLEASGNLSVLKYGRLQTVYRVHAQQPYQNGGVYLYRDAIGRVWSYGANNGYLYRHEGPVVNDSLAVPAGTRWWQWTVGARGNVYMAADNGSVYQLTGGCWKEILTKTQARGFVYEVREEADGTIWICSSGGLLRVNRKQYGNVSAASPVVYFTTDGEGRYVLRNDSLLFSIPAAVENFQALRAKDLTGVYVTKTKEVWYCTEEAVYWLPYGKPLQRLNTTQTYEGTKAAFRFRRVLEDDAGGRWISSYHGIFYKKGDSLRYYFDREGLTEGAVYTAAIDKAGIFYTAGVHVYAMVKGRFQNISEALHLPDEISRLSTDNDKNVWVCQEGTNTAVKIGVTRDGHFYRADSVKLALNGLPFAATSLCFDAQNNLWVCDNHALYCYRYAPGGYGALPVYLDENLSGSPLLYASGNNRLQVLSHPLAGNYLYTYAVEDLLHGVDTAAPQLRLTAVRLFRQVFDWRKAGFAANALGVPQRLRLAHNQNFLQFSFAGLTPGYSRNIAYRYRLLGYDRDWSPVTARGEADYTGLPAGAYTFEVQARNAGGLWSPSLAYNFSIDVVWYRTWWAVVLWALLALNAFIAVLHYRGQYMERKARVKQLMVEEQLKALRAQINPHFLQNIFAFLAHELYASQNTRALKALDRLSAYLRNVLRLSDKTAVTLEEELGFAEEYLQMQQQLLSVRFWYSINMADEVDVFDVQVPSMLLQPILENALKYGMDATARNSIIISIRADEQYIRCIISDSGSKTANPALPLQNPGSGKGLELTQERMRLFYRGKKRPPKFFRSGNGKGGCDVTLLLPVE